MPAPRAKCSRRCRCRCDLGADVNAVDNNGETAMHAAAYKNLPKVVKFLAAKGARIDVWNQPEQVRLDAAGDCRRLPVRQLQAVARHRGRRFAK